MTNEQSEVIRAIKLSQLELELMDVNIEIRRLEGVINSAKIKNQSFKDNARKKLIKKMKEQDRLTTKITEAMLLDTKVH